MRDDLVKLTVNMGEEAVAAIKSLARKRSTSMTRVIAQAISTLAFLDEAQRSGEQLILRKGDVEREVVLR